MYSVELIRDFYTHMEWADGEVWRAVAENSTPTSPTNSCTGRPSPSRHAAAGFYELLGRKECDAPRRESILNAGRHSLQRSSILRGSDGLPDKVWKIRI